MRGKSSNSARLESMDFWSIIERTKPNSRGVFDQIAKIEKTLESATPQEMVAFRNKLEELAKESFTPKIFAAGYIISCSGARFKTLQLIFWLILQGRPTWEKTMAEPSHLIGFDLSEQVPPADFVDVAHRAYKQSTGRKWDAEKINTTSLAMNVINGGRLDDFNNAKKHAAELYPQLYQKFWDVNLAPAKIESDKQSRNEAIIKKADEGDPFAAKMAGALFFDGRHIPQNIEKAFYYFTFAAEKGDLEAQTFLGGFYLHGEGVEKNLTKAAFWLKKAADRGDEESQYEYGQLLFKGEGVERNIKEALRYLTFAADAQFAKAQASLGDIYSQGKEVPKDDSVALNWYKKAAKQGHAGAQYMLGVFKSSGRGGQQNLTEAVHHYECAAEIGFARAWIALGLCYQSGNGVVQDYTKARECYEKAAQKNLPLALNNLGDMYENGLGGEQNYAKAIDLYQKAAAAGLAIANRSLGNVFEKGLGVSADRSEAIRYYKAAAEKGDKQALAEITRLESLPKN